jgi:hypothetical protein
MRRAMCDALAFNGMVHSHEVAKVVPGMPGDSVKLTGIQSIDINRSHEIGWEPNSSQAYLPMITCLNHTCGKPSSSVDH